MREIAHKALASVFLALGGTSLPAVPKEEPGPRQVYNTPQAAAAQLRFTTHSRKLISDTAGVKNTQLAEALKLVLSSGVNEEGLKKSTEHFSSVLKDPKATADDQKIAKAMDPYIAALKAQLEKEGRNGVPERFAENCVKDTLMLSGAK
jgi:hypothetical protein